MGIYLAIDPGKTAGWATFDEQGEQLAFGQVKFDDHDKWLVATLKPGNVIRIILERYRVAHWDEKKAKANAGTDVPTLQQIGSIKTIAGIYDVPVSEQEPSVYPIGAMWGGFEIPKNHSISHQYVAVAHGIYWLQQNGVRKPRIPE